MILAATPNVVLLDLPAPVEGGWRVHPELHRVARPYDVDTVVPSPRASPPPPPDAAEDLSTRPTKRRKVKPLRCIPDDDETKLVAWIQQELSTLKLTSRARELFRDHSSDKFGTLVLQPPSEAFAVDFAGQAEMLQLLKHGFGSRTKVASSTDEEEPFASLLLHQGTNYVDHISNVYETLVFPPRSTWVISDFAQIRRLTTVGGFDIVVMDPPWSNASVNRMAHYATMDMYELFKIPIPKLLSRTTPPSTSSTPSSSSSPLPIVAVWITNRPKVYNLVTKKLFPAWGLDFVACWYWLKVTTLGEPVLSLENHHRRPYERILIGRVKSASSCPSSSSSTHEPASVNAESTRPIDRKLIVSVPGLHSRKPCLGPLIEKEFFAPQEHGDSVADPGAPSAPLSPLNKLELFARCLEPGWVSWGNEPIRFQYCGHGDLSSMPPHAELVQDGYLIPEIIEEDRKSGLKED
ncbi:Methyltransferase-like protein 4 [Actinomortierella ambigua]|nr:Methyltransferase-like protein 4 [Actinomortierella ambigua]